MRSTYDGTPLIDNSPKVGVARDAIRLKFNDITKRTYTGNICVVIQSTDCEFPDD